MSRENEVRCPECVDRGYETITCKACGGSGWIDPVKSLRGVSSPKGQGAQ